MLRTRQSSFIPYLEHVVVFFINNSIFFCFVCFFAFFFFFHFLYIVVQCPDPGKPVNGAQVVNKGFVYGGSVTFTCDKDYTLRGKSTIYCQEDKQWTASIPRCLGECL